MNTDPDQGISTRLFDSNKLSQVLETDDQALLESLYSHYQHHMATIIEALHTAIRVDQDLIRGAGLAHSVRASSLSIGALQVAELLADLEIHCEQNNNPGCQQLLTQLDEAWPATCAAMRQSPTQARHP